MPQLQKALVASLREALPPGATLVEEWAPPWLLRPGRAEAGAAWQHVQAVYGELTGLVLPDEMPPRERRRLDVVVTFGDGARQVVEVDESQHFTGPRGVTLGFYDRMPVCFDVDAWADRCAARAGREPGSGFAKPRPPLFPGPGGRHRQRAFRDFLADLLPSLHGWLPTLRVSDSEAEHALAGGGAALPDLMADKAGDHASRWGLA